MKLSERDYELAAKVAKLHDDMLIGPAELAAFLGVSEKSIMVGSVKVPERVSGFSRKRQWRFGDVRAFVRTFAQAKVEEIMSATVTPQKRGRGRPTKAELVVNNKL